MVMRFGLRARMAASYVLVTAAAVLAVEGVLLGLIVPRILSGSDRAGRTQYQAAVDARTLRLFGTKISALAVDKADRREFFAALTRSGVQDTAIGGAAADADGVKIPFTLDWHTSTVEALVGTDELVIASSAPQAYPPGSRLALGHATSGSATGVAKTRLGTVRWAASPVVISLPTRVPPHSPAPRPPTGTRAAPPGTLGPLKAATREMRVGTVYVQVPAEGGGTSLLPVAPPGIAVGAAVLAMIIPVGVVFGLLSMGGVIRRVRRLADVTAAMSAGDFGARVPVDRPDEIGRLEDGFNRMAEQLDTALDTERRLAVAGARQAERERIARELHDSISQDLFSMSLLANGLCKALPTGSALRAEAKAMEQTAARTMREMQALLLELRPVALEDAGLRPALAELCRAYEARLGVSVDADLDEVTPGPQAEHAVLRVVQEALGNAIKHASPDRIRVHLTTKDGMVGVEVCDDGVGFDPGQVADRHGVGLTVMRERIEELGGSFTVTSRPGDGTVIRARLPAAPGALAAPVAGVDAGGGGGR